MSDIKSMDNQAKLQLIKDHIGEFLDFPKPGIIFKWVFCYDFSVINGIQVYVLFHYSNLVSL